MKKLKGKDFTPATIIKYANTHLRLKQFIKFKYHRTDLFLYELNYQFISGFESFLKQKFNNSGTTCYKHYQRFTRVIHKAMHKGYIDKYPFENYKIKSNNARNRKFTNHNGCNPTMEWNKKLISGVLS